MGEGAVGASGWGGGTKGQLPAPQAPSVHCLGLGVVRPQPLRLLKSLLPIVWGPDTGWAGLALSCGVGNAPRCTPICEDPQGFPCRLTSLPTHQLRGWPESGLLTCTPVGRHGTAHGTLSPPSTSGRTSSSSCPVSLSFWRSGDSI